MSSSPKDYVKVEVNTPRKVVNEGFAFADLLFAHLDRLQLEPADMIDFSASNQNVHYGQTALEAVRITFRWLGRPWLNDPSQPDNVLSNRDYLCGLPTANKDLAGQNGKGLLCHPVEEDRYLQEGTHNWYLSMDCRDGALYICLPRCVMSSAKYLRQIKAMLRQPAWHGSRSDSSGFCVYTGQWFDTLDPGSPCPIPELFDPGAHYWYTNDRPYAGDPGRSVVPQASMGYGSICCCKGTADPFNDGTPQFTADDGLWKMRERARLDRGVYNKLPERVLEALDMSKLQHCYPHMAVQEDHSGMVAYTRDEAAGIRDRQLVMKPGRFIKQFARDHSISDDEVKYLAAAACGTVEITFKSTHDRKEISKVYQRGPQSCMAYGPLARDTFDGDHLKVNGEFVHPCEIYAHPDNDIELVYGVLGEDDPVVRTLVNTRKKLYCAIYVKDSPSSAREQMERHLKKQGFKYGDEVLHGQKLLLIETDDRSIISPYLDPGNIGVRIDRDDDCLVAGEGGEGANHATGTLNSYTGGSANDWTCECCGDDQEDDDDDDSDHDRDGNRICRSCLNEHYTQAFITSEGDERYVRDSETLHSCCHVSSGDLSGYSYVFFNSSRRDIGFYGCVELDTSRYTDGDRPMIANLDDCVKDDNDDWLLRDDLDSYDLFVDEDGDAHECSEWVAVTNEDGEVLLMERSDLEEELYDKAPSSHEDWPMLDFYILMDILMIDEDEDEDPVNTLTDDEDECPDQSVA